LILGVSIFIWLFANRCKGKNVRKCRELLGLSRDLPEAVNRWVQEMMLKLTGKDITLCPCCKKGTMRSVGLIPEGSGPSGFEILHPPGQQRSSGMVSNLE